MVFICIMDGDAVTFGKVGGIIYDESQFGRRAKVKMLLDWRWLLALDAYADCNERVRSVMWHKDAPHVVEV